MLTVNINKTPDCSHSCCEWELVLTLQPLGISGLIKSVLHSNEGRIQSALGPFFFFMSQSEIYRVSSWVCRLYSEVSNEMVTRGFGVPAPIFPRERSSCKSCGGGAPGASCTLWQPSPFGRRAHTPVSDLTKRALALGRLSRRRRAVQEGVAPLR